MDLNPRRLPIRGLSAVDNLDNAFGINSYCLRLPKEKNHAVVPWCAELSGCAKRILHAIVQTNCKESKGLPFRDILDLFDFHRRNLTAWFWQQQSERAGVHLQKPLHEESAGVDTGA
jgi:hypothetical protein